MTHKVAIFGGGVGGLSAAHELKRVGKDLVEVTVYERRDIVGGKARSTRTPAGQVPGSALPALPGNDYPGEHGFRFFPGYYRHVIKTMERIPHNGKTVADHLTDAMTSAFVGSDDPPPTPGEDPRVGFIAMPNRQPHSLQDVLDAISMGKQIKMPMDKVKEFGIQFGKFMVSCDQRRHAEYDDVVWLKFCNAQGYGKTKNNYTKYLADGLNQRTVAASGSDVCARTVALTLTRIIADWCHPGSCIDRVLDGPTTEVWINPWRAELDRLGVKFVHDRELVGVNWNAAQGITAATVQVGGDPTATETIHADSYISAIPMSDAQRVFVDTSGMGVKGTGFLGLAVRYPDFGALRDNWMNGLQLYLDAPLDLVDGHVIYTDSSFSLTSISQNQFWLRAGFDISALGDGRVKSILSVDISDFDEVCTQHGTKGFAHSKDELVTCVVRQVREHLEFSQPTPGFTMPNVLGYHLDDALRFGDARAEPGFTAYNEDALFINTAGSWRNRPNAIVRNTPGGGLPNLYVASDYAKTDTDLATMEGANEAGRLSARGVLEQMGQPQAVQEEVELFTFEDVPFGKMKVLREADEWAFKTSGFWSKLTGGDKDKGGRAEPGPYDPTTAPKVPSVSTDKLGDWFDSIL